VIYKRAITTFKDRCW